MSLHRGPKMSTPQINSALIEAGLPVDKPSQLSDAFRLGWMAAMEDIRLTTPLDVTGYPDGYVVGKTDAN